MKPEYLPDTLWPFLYRASVAKEWPPRDRNDALNFVAGARKERLLPLLFAAAPSLPGIVQDALADHSALARLSDSAGMLLQDDLHAFREAMAGEEFILLKGAAYAYSIYGDFSLRPMQDLDVLVRRERMAVVAKKMMRTGRQPFRANRTSSWARSYPEMIFRFEHTIVEVHQAVVQRSRHSIDYDSIWARRQAVPSLSPEGFCADLDHQFLLQCVALLKEEFRVKLVHYVDLWLLAQRISNDLENTARAWNIVGAVAGSLRNLRRAFPETEGIPGIRDLAVLDAQACRIALESIPAPDSPGRERTSPGKKLLIKLGLMDRMSIRIRFLLAHAWAVIEGAVRSTLRWEPW